MVHNNYDDDNDHNNNDFWPTLLNCLRNTRVVDLWMRRVARMKMVGNE
jgi:hypothetical protein